MSGKDWRKGNVLRRWRFCWLFITREESIGYPANIQTYWLLVGRFMSHTAPSLAVFRQRLKTCLFSCSYLDMVIWFTNYLFSLHSCYSGHVKNYENDDNECRMCPRGAAELNDSHIKRASVEQEAVSRSVCGLFQALGAATDLKMLCFHNQRYIGTCRW